MASRDAALLNLAEAGLRAPRFPCPSFVKAHDGGPSGTRGEAGLETASGSRTPGAELSLSLETATRHASAEGTPMQDRDLIVGVLAAQTGFATPSEVLEAAAAGLMDGKSDSLLTRLAG